MLLLGGVLGLFFYKNIYTVPAKESSVHLEGGDTSTKKPTCALLFSPAAHIQGGHKYEKLHLSRMTTTPSKANRL